MFIRLLHTVNTQFKCLSTAYFNKIRNNIRNELFKMYFK
jgi:hypothetical protein